MAHREISGQLLRVCFGAVYKEATPAKLLTFVLEQIAFTQRDLDITGDMDSAMYYTGFIDAMEMVAHQIAPIKEGKEKTFFDLIDKIWKPATEAAA